MDTMINIPREKTVLTTIIIKSIIRFNMSNLFTGQFIRHQPAAKSITAVPVKLNDTIKTNIATAIIRRHHHHLTLSQYVYNTNRTHTATAIANKLGCPYPIL